MRQVLLELWLQQPWSWWTDQADGPPRMGACWVWIIGGALIFLFHAVKGNQEFLKDSVNWLIWGVGLIALSIVRSFGVLPEAVPIFGYGAMVLVGFLTGMWFTSQRAKAIGMEVDLITDVAFWILVFGIGGGRIAYLIQYRDRVFANTRGLGDVLFQAVNLPDGGLVLIGALMGGTLGLLVFCYRRQLNAFELLDVLMPAVFIGIGFGRVGCLLNGCCYGGACDLPWAITFAPGTVPFDSLVMRGVVEGDALRTIPLHPTQIYSAVNGFILAIITGTFYWYRRHPGDVFALACILYPITRIQLELLRNDELGQLGTSLTISQFYSLAILTFGIVLLAMGPKRQQFWAWTSMNGTASSVKQAT